MLYGSLLSHGIAIIFGSALGNINNENFRLILNLITNLLFIIIGIIILLKKEDIYDNKTVKNNVGISYILIIAFSIAIGEIGDKTFLASIGLGITYPIYKASLILGAILGMVISDYLAIVLGKILSKKISNSVINKISGILFIIFGILGYIKLI